MRVLLALMFALFALPALAFDTPKALIEAIYAPYTTLGAATAQDPAQYYSERLKGLVALNAAGAEGGAPKLEFNPLIGAQQALLRDLFIGEPVVAGTRATATVRFQNFDQTSLLTLALVEEEGGWKVDDIASLGDGENWLLSWLLQYDPFAIK